MKCEKYLLWRLRSTGVSVTDLDMLRKTLVIPKIFYAFPAWCNTNKGEAKRLANVYQRIAKIGSPELLPSCQCICDKAILSLFISALQQTHILNNLMPVLPEHNYLMRRQRLHLPNVKLQALKDHFIFKGILLFNNSQRF